ncbi:MAG: hypothetical protein WD184_06980 [Acidimicrobiia bacterium]
MRILAAVFLLLVLAGCGDDAASPSSTTDASPTTTGLPASTSSTVVTTTATTVTLTLPSGGTDLPTTDFDTLAAIFDPLLEPLGYRLGRAALIDLETYEESPEATHLAVYLTPLAAKSPDEYAAEIVPVARVFLPAVFETWPGLESFDVCQEPFEFEGDTPPPGLTVLDLDRAAAEAIDWASLDLAGLLDARQEHAGLFLHAQSAIKSSATWEAAEG